INQIESIIRKIDAIDKNNLRQSQKTLLERRVVALTISLQLLNEQLDNFKESTDERIIKRLGQKKS
ncbi:MAG TPA: hypothetical protein DEA45_03015, partial [Acholeplasmataceae bacterium]|nr:hypothetical protein [Acholeplasmataceae bacterium]